MTTERIKELQQKTAYPNSVSVMLALNQVWNECQQEKTMSEQDKEQLIEDSYDLNLQNLSGREDFQQAFKLGIMTGVDETLDKLNDIK
jgi:hypothetical protein